MLHRWTPLFVCFFLNFNGGLPKLLILALCTGWIINSRQTNHTDEITAVVKDEQWRLSVLLLLLKLACVGYEQENKMKANREQIVPYFENTLWQRGSASSCVWRHFRTVCSFTAMWDLKKNTGTWWMELRIYLCQYVLKITAHFNLTRTDQSIKLLLLELRVNVALVWTFMLFLSVIYSGDSSPLMLSGCSSLAQNNVYLSKTGNKVK